MERDLPPLPLPVRLGGPAEPWGPQVEAYARAHGISKAETCRRVAAVTGTSPRAIENRSGHKIWWGMSRWERP